MAVTRDDLLHVAELARLEVSEASVAELLRQLIGILQHMEVLARVDTEGVCAAEGVGDAATPLREDRGPPVPLFRQREQFAPEARDGFFLVPRLATHDTGDPELPE